MNRFTAKPRYPRTTPKLVINVTPAEKRELERVASHQGVTVAECVRQALRAAGVLPSL
jgi:hypothetical protein